MGRVVRLDSGKRALRPGLLGLRHSGVETHPRTFRRNRELASGSWRHRVAGPASRRPLHAQPHPTPGRRARCRDHRQGPGVRHSTRCRGLGVDRHLTRRSPESAESLLCGRSRRPATGHGVHLHRASGIRPDPGGGRRGSRSRPYGSTCDVSVAGPGPGHLPTSSLSHGDGRRTGRRWDRRRRRREPGGSRGRGSRAVSGFERILAGDRSRYPKHALGPARELARGLAHLLRDGPRPYPAEPSWTDSRFERDSCRSCGGDPER